MSYIGQPSIPTKTVVEQQLEDQIEALQRVLDGEKTPSRRSKQPPSSTAIAPVGDLPMGSALEHISTNLDTAMAQFTSAVQSNAMVNAPATVSERSVASVDKGPAPVYDAQSSQLAPQDLPSSVAQQPRPVLNFSSLPYSGVVASEPRHIQTMYRAPMDPTYATASGIIDSRRSHHMAPLPERGTFVHPRPSKRNDRIYGAQNAHHTYSQRFGVSDHPSSRLQRNDVVDLSNTTKKWSSTRHNPDIARSPVSTALHSINVSRSKIESTLTQAQRRRKSIEARALGGRPSTHAAGSIYGID